MSTFEIIAAILVIAFMVWVWRLKPEPYHEQHYVEQLKTGVDTNLPVGWIPYLIPIVLALGGYVVYLFLISKPGKQRMSISELARTAKIAYGTAHALYHEKSGRIDLDTLNGLCRALNVQPGDIFTYIPDK